MGRKKVKNSVVVRPRGERPLCRTGLEWEGNIKMVLEDLTVGGLGCAHSLRTGSAGVLSH
jgi:hypothetical protein